MKALSGIVLTGVFMCALLGGSKPANAQHVEIIPPNPTSADSVTLVGYGNHFFTLYGGCDYGYGTYCSRGDDFTVAVQVVNWAGCVSGGCSCNAQIIGYGEIGRCELGQLPVGHYVFYVWYETRPYEITYSETLSIDVTEVTGVDGEAGLYPHPSVLRAYPNPSSGAITFAGQRIARGEATGRLRVFDAGGRLVLEKAVTVSGERFNERWDGRSGSGARVPAGVYQARLELGEEAWTSRFVLVH